MTMSLDFGSLSQAYADGTLSPADITAGVYDRIATQGERPVWISLVPREQALDKVQIAPRGPLYGLPFAVKDNIDVAGMPTTCACPEFSYIPQRSATVVERLEAAGAILIGKTNLDQFATGLVGTRSPYGIPSSVFNADYISGGSSSGSAVAVASGLVSFALGTDTAGSGRVPAAFNNIVGLKPTKGLISTRGVVPACRSQDAVSVFALTVGDAAAVTAVASEFDVQDAFSRRMPRRRIPQSFEPGLKIGVPASDLEFFGDNDYAQLYDRTIARLIDLGATRVPIDFAPFRDAARLLYSGPWVAERFAAIAPFASARADALHDVVRDIILGSRDISAVNAFEGMYKLANLIRSAEAEWQKMDVMVLPTAATTYRIADVLADPKQLNSNLGLYTNFVNLMDLSALAVPAGFRDDGLPFGVTLIGCAFEDGRLAAVGDRLHRSLANCSLGATETPLSQTTAVPQHRPHSNTAAVAVVGAHLSGQPLHWQLTERSARFVRTARTASGYRLYALADTKPPKPGLVFDGSGQGNIEVEVWEMDETAFGSFVNLIPAPLGIGTLELADGTAVKGFICEAHAAAGAKDITSFGGWRCWLASQLPGQVPLTR